MHVRADNGSESPSDAASSRAALLKVALAATGAVGAGSLIGWVRAEPVAAASRRQDVRILNFLLLLEYLQEAFYSEALAAGRLRGELRQFAGVVGGHEREHVQALRRALGAAARDKPRFSFGEEVRDADEFRRAASTIEETAAAAYIGQGANLTAEGIRTTVRIVAVEARHAAWILDIEGRLPAPAAADQAAKSDDVMRRLERSGFVAES